MAQAGRLVPAVGQRSEAAMKRSPLPPRKNRMPRAGKARTPEQEALRRWKADQLHVAEPFRTGNESARDLAYYIEQRALVLERAGGFRCEMPEHRHHLECPRIGRGWLIPDGGDMVTHHIHEKAKGGTDDADNLLLLWAPLGVNGCHGRIHDLGKDPGEHVPWAVKEGLLWLPRYAA